MEISKGNKIILAASAVFAVVGISSMVYTAGNLYKKGKFPLTGQNRPNVRSQNITGFRTPQIDYAEASKKLNIAEETLREALSVNEGQRPNLQSVATKLGISIEDLRDALGYGDRRFAPSPTPTL